MSRKIYLEMHNTIRFMERATLKAFGLIFFAKDRYFANALRVARSS